jgi:hypothetical protein
VQTTQLRRALSTAVLAVLVVLFGTGGAGATEVDMAQLPVVVPNLCLTCHTITTPMPGDVQLNVFGEDFLANGRLWNPALAQLDSDEDGCLNGVEIGDADGDGRADGNVDRHSGNPGVPGDCTTVVGERTWTALKALFDGRR